MILRQKKISEAGTQQLLLDTYNLKTLLLHIHGVGAEHKMAPPMLFTKLIQAQSAQIETTLKLVGTPDEKLLERCRIMMPEGKVEDIVSVMSLKGMKRTEMQPIIDKAIAQLGNISSSGKQLPTAAGTRVSNPPAASTTNVGSNSSSSNSSSSSVPLVSGAAMASMAMASSMRNLTNDISSSARSALKWK